MLACETYVSFQLRWQPFITNNSIVDFFQISDEIRMRRLSNGIITFAGLLIIMTLVYRHHTKEIPLDTRSNSRKDGPSRSFKDRLNSKDITHETPGGISQDFSDVAQLIDPPAGKATRWNIPTSIRLCLVAIIVIMAVVVVVIGRYSTSFSRQQAFLQHLHAP